MLEQFQWRTEKVLSGLTFLAAVGAVYFAVKTYYQTKRQADIARWVADDTDRPALFVFLDTGTGSEKIVSIVARIQSISGDRAAIVNYIEAHIAPTVPQTNWTSADVCISEMGDQIVNKGTPVMAHCDALHLASGTHFYGLVGYRSIEGTRWRRTFDYFWDGSHDRWTHDASSIFNRDVRVNGLGDELHEPE